MPVLPAAEREYLAALGGRLGEIGGDRLVGVILSGSAAVDAYAPGSSDLDVLVVCDGLDPAIPAAIAERCSHGALRCPARKLELVVYERAEVAAPARRPGWALNLNSGEGLHRVGTRPEDEPSHWFVLDLAFARRHGVALAGPSARKLIGEVEEPVVAEALAASVAWYARHEPGRPAVTAACRAWHYRETGELASKPAALAWAADRIAGEPG